MATHRLSRTMVCTLSLLLLAALVSGPGLLNHSPPTVLAQSPGSDLGRKAALASNPLLSAHAETSFPDYSFSLSPTSATPSTYRVTLTIGDLGGVTPPSSDWYGPGGAPVSQSCSGGPNLIREYFYSSGVLYEVRDYFYISACTREPGQYHVTVAPDFDDTFTITVPPTIHRTFLPFVQKPPHLPGDFTKVSPADGAVGQQPVSMTLDWEDSVDADAYAYCYDTTDDSACADWVEAGTASQAEVGGLSENTTYYWQVRAANSLGTTYADGADTAYWSFTTGEAFAGRWTQVATPWWAARWGHTSVALPDGSIVLLGGYGDSRQKDVWRSTDQGATWAEMTASAPWTARHGLSSVTLPDGSIILMGGHDGTFSYKHDVWRSTDQGATWTEMTTAAGWTARRFHTSVTLPDGSIVLMGGDNGSGSWNDVWRSTDQGATWTQQTAAAEWTARTDHTSVALPDGSIVLMGGYDGSRRNDVWRSTDQGATWTQLTSTASWTARSSLRSVVLSDGSIVLMGGSDGSVRNDVWRSTDQGATWTEMTAATLWPARSGHTSVALSDGSIVLMGGSPGGLSGMDDVWRSTDQGATWTQMTAADPWWTARSGHTSVVLLDGSIVLMAGSAGSTRYHDVWRSTDQGATWTQMTAAAGWSSRSRPFSVALPDDSIVLMGGTDSGGRRNDVWRSTDQGATWTQMTAAAEWTARNSHTSVVLADGSIVLMGGVGADYWRDVWRSTDQGATWTQQTAAAEWEARTSHTSVALPDGSIVLMGGFGGLSVGNWNDVWRSTDQGATWTEATAAAPWTARTGHTSVALPDGSIVLMGGDDDSLRNDVWHSTDQGATWSQWAAAAPWTARYNHTSVVLPDSSIVLMGGLGGGSLRDVWRLETAGAAGR
ncbi:MAG: exo-alpha-sialidase [Anaerolineae bacterium]|nr:exo-alpha-sialidase [Anaerolineae bacterium]